MSRIFRLISILEKTQRNYGTGRNSNTYYDLLNVSQDASKKDIRLAFLKLSKEVHPDTSAKSDKTSHDEFIKINEAYNVLSNDLSRQQYDINLKCHKDPYKTIFRPENETADYYKDPMWHNSRYYNPRRNHRNSNNEYYRNAKNIHSTQYTIFSICWLILFFGGLIQITSIRFKSALDRSEVRSDLEKYGHTYDANRSRAQMPGNGKIDDVFEDKFFGDDVNNDLTKENR